MSAATMNFDIRVPCMVAMLSAVPLTAHAQTVYKCTIDGKVSYGDQPCPTGAVSAGTLDVPAAPPPDPKAASQLARQQKQLAALEKSRRERDAADAKADKLAAKSAGVKRAKCDKLKLTKQWADEDVRRASAAKLDDAKLRAKRAGETLALECTD